MGYKTIFSFCLKSTKGKARLPYQNPIPLNANLRKLPVVQLLDVCEVRYPEFAVNVTLDGVCHVSVHTVPHRLTGLHGSEVAVETALCKHIGIVPPARAWSVQVGHHAVCQHERLPNQPMCPVMPVIYFPLEVLAWQPARATAPPKRPIDKSTDVGPLTYHPACLDMDNSARVKCARI